MSEAAPVCAVVGYGPGLGDAIARRFLAGGLRVAGLCRDPSRYAGLAADGITLQQADASDHAGLRAVLTAQGDIRVLVYNAYSAALTPGGPSALEPAALTADLAVNVVGALVAAQAVLPRMRQAGAGTVLFTGGGLAFDPTGWLPAASLAIGKAGLRNLAFSLNADLAPQGIHAGTVTVAGTVQPGTPFAPDLIADAFWSLHADAPGAFRPEIVFRG